ncbi:hypothetical protein DI09_31p150 [Mitosporidium daphniae]|uniref:Uncharacterized protein n=1 Tax=Mitosporidium daphniae TaxID=1485682 RepID=A0A098VRX0_9MICR|nr:uncharacterized protein DI09_31p150 [Mitosporidium daphniae]KGG51564.1 hypothetical protein DI09_31p150 [Mitosporidium daphniae]|eukprot:XP_013237991.1 uncharacterized protein DI09_31p150 [Mitosporidium daphniae]
MWAAGGGSGIGGRLVSSASRLMSHTSVFSVAVRVAISRKTFNGSSVSTRSVFMEPSAYPWRKPPRDHPYEGGNGRPRSKSWRYSAYLKVFFILTSRQKESEFEPKKNTRSDR